MDDGDGYFDLDDVENAAEFGRTNAALWLPKQQIVRSYSGP